MGLGWLRALSAHEALEREWNRNSFCSQGCNEYDLICYFIILHVIKSEYGLPRKALQDADEKKILQD